MAEVNPPSSSIACDAGERLLIVSNRLPISARGRAGRMRIVRSSGGLATGLDNVRRTERSLWIGWAGTAAHLATASCARLERRLHDEGLAAVSLSGEDVAGYYDGFSNGVIWPLFHHLLDRIPLDSGNWNAYQRVNERFASTIERLWRPGDRIWIHDYHLMRLPALLRQRLPDARIGFFLHIPFPSVDVFRTLPWRRELLEGVLGADVLGFHTPAYAAHFLTAVRQLIGVEAMGGHLWWQGRPIHVEAMPMGVDDRRLAAISDRPAVRERADAIRADANGRKILLGVDRLDYTKGIPRRLMAFQRLLERNPTLIGQVRFIQLAVPSRIDVRAYRAFRRELDELIGRINGAFGTVGTVPIHYLYRSLPLHELVALYRAADVMVVTPLRDGMNLIAKEFVAARTDDDGVLLLSEFAGAAAELTDALIVNPYDVDGVADAMARALTMDGDERRRRMRGLRRRVSASSVHDWAQGFLKRLGTQEPDAAPPAGGGPLDAMLALESARLTVPSRVTLLVDYDGTLVPLAATPDGAQPDADLLGLLAALAAHPQIELHIVTGRSMATVQQWFCHIPAGLWAEHGAVCRRTGGVWERVVASDGCWMDRVRQLFDDACARTPGALMEEKTTGLAWHYRMVDPDLAAAELRRIMDALPLVLDGASAEVLEGRMVLEIRPRGVSKALVVRCLAGEAVPGAPMIAIGDDRSDEEMFGAMPRSGIAIHVGDGETRAPYTLEHPFAVRQFLARLLATRPGSRSVRLQRRQSTG